MSGGFSTLNGVEARLDRVLESLGDYSMVVQSLHDKLHDFKHIDSLPAIADGIRALNKTMIWTHIAIIGSLTLFVVLLLLKDSGKDLTISPTGLQFQESRPH